MENGKDESVLSCSSVAPMTTTICFAMLQHHLIHEHLTSHHMIFCKEIFLEYKTPELGLFGTLKLALALQFIVTNTYFSVACNTKVSVRATLK